MDDPITSRIIELLAGSIDIPVSAYEKAERRYKDLGAWFERSESRCSSLEPHIYPQGSFRLGTVVKPLGQEEEFDLDLGCRLRSGISKESHSQKQLKQLVGQDLADYRLARGIKEKPEEMHRCWRLSYADTLNFHMDVVPSIPESSTGRRIVKEAMVRTGATSDLADAVSSLAGAITDDRRWNYAVVHDDWLVSNSEGYARWFAERMKLAKVLLEKRAYELRKAKIDELPVHEWQSPLQRSVQILKRHRDVRFADQPDSRPISIIITTLAAQAYNGEPDVPSALTGILNRMSGLVRAEAPRVPNPVNPSEDFADKWPDPRYAHLRLEQTFWQWLAAAQSDLKRIAEARDIDVIVKAASAGFSTKMDESSLRSVLSAPAVSSLLKPAAQPSEPTFPDRRIAPRKPSGFA